MKISMDPVTAISNAYTATLALITAIVNKLSPEAAEKIVVVHEARLDAIHNLFIKIVGKFGN